MKVNNSDKNTNFELNQHNSVNERYKLNSTEKYRSKTVKISTIIFIFAMFVVAIGLIFKEGEKSLPPGSSYSYLEGTDYTKGDIKVKGVQLKIYQDSGEGYQDVTSTGFDLNTKTFATDVRYNYDLIIKNDEKATVTADQYYLRWNFIALVDNQEYDITDYCKVDTAFVYKQKDADGKTRFYSVSGTSANTISAQNQLAFLSSIRFDGVYDNLTHKYGSILDNEFSGSKIKIIANIEGSLTPYEIILPTIKFYNTDGSIMQATTVKEIGLVSIPTETPTSSITVDGETLYFQGWLKNGVAGVIYAPNEEVEVGENDVFTPYYAVDADYSTTFAYTQDPVTGELTISGVNSNLTEITIPALIQGEPVTMIKNSAFYSYTKLKTVTMPQTITKIGDYAFYGCSNLTSINIPESVTTIGNYAFRGCNKLESIKLPNTLNTIGDDAFSSCLKLTSITIPKSVIKIGSFVFDSCQSLISIVVNSENANYCSEDGVLFNKSKSTLIKYPEAKTNVSYTISENIKSISTYAFYGCKNLTLIDVDSNNTVYCSIDGVLYNKAKTILIQYPAGKTGDSYTILDGVTGIYGGAFSYCENLTTINLPDGLHYWESRVFYSCKNLTSIVIPDSVTTIGSYMFYNCSSLESVTLSKNLSSISSNAFMYCMSLTSIAIPDNVTKIDYQAFYGCSSLTSIVIPDSVINLGFYTFYNCSSLETVTLGNGLTSIETSTFRGCKSLTSITIPNNVISLGPYAFYGCSNLTSIKIPDSVTKLGNVVFWGCSALTSVEFENTTGWYATTSSSYTDGTSIDVTNSSTNATNFKNSSGSWYSKYLYRE